MKRRRVNSRKMQRRRNRLEKHSRNQRRFKIKDKRTLDMLK